MNKITSVMADTDISGIDHHEFAEYIGKERYRLYINYLNGLWVGDSQWLDLTDCRSLWYQVLDKDYSEDLFKFTMEYIIIFTENNTCETDALKEYYEFITNNELSDLTYEQMLDVYLVSLKYLTGKTNLNFKYLPVNWLNGKLKVIGG